MKQIYIATSLLLTLVLVGCGESSTQSEDSTLTKQIHQVDLTQVKVVTLAPSTFHKQLISNGRTEAWSKSKISFASTGVIETINVREGQWVNKGDVLSSLDISDLSLALDRARLNFDKAAMDYEDKLLDFGYKISDTLSIPPQTKRTAAIRSGYNEAVFGLREAQTNYDRAVLRAPFSGKVASINASLFETPSAEFCTLVDDRSMRVRFSILESEISLVRVGQGVQIIPFNDSQKQYQGKIESINPIVEDKGQILITAIISNTGGSLIDGQNVKILIEDAVADQLVVPKSAVVVRDNQDVLFRLDNSRALWTYVNIVMANSQEYVVSANLDRGADLNVGDTIIISGNLNLGDGAQVQVVD